MFNPLLAVSALSVFGSVLAVSPTTTTKACHPTLVSNPPKALICGDRGTLSHPYALQPANKVGSLQACQKRCAGYVGCVSFGYASDGTCQPLGKTVRSQDIKKGTGPKAQAFYNHKCFSTCPNTFPTASSTTTTSVPTDTSTPVPTVDAQAVPYYKNATVKNIAAASTKSVLYGATDPSNNVLYFILDLVSNSSSAPLVNLESFIPFVSSAQCSASLITLEFTTSAAYKVATSWPSKFFLITTGPNYCGTSDGNRTFYEVTKPSFTASDNSVSLPVSQVDFNAVQTGFSIEFGTQTANQQAALIRRSSRSSKKPKAFVPAMADAVRDHFSTKGLVKRASANTPFVYPLSPGSFQFTNANPQSGNQYGAGPIEFNCNNGTYGCGLTADITLGGRASCEATGYCSPEDFAVDVNVMNPSISAAYITSYGNTGGTVNVNYAADLATLTFYKIIVNPVCEFDFVATLEETFIATTVGQYEVGGIGYTAANFSSFSLDYDNPGNQDPININFNPNYQVESPGSTGYNPGSLDISHSTGPRIGINFVPAQGDVALTHPHYQGVSIGGPAIQFQFQRINGTGAPQCQGYDPNGPPAYLSSLITSFNMNGVVQDSTEFNGGLTDMLFTTSTTQYNGKCFFL